MLGMPGRIERERGRHALVDGIPFDMPVNSDDASALMAIFPVSYGAAAALLPGDEIHPLRLWKSALLIVTVVNYRATDIGNYIEFSVGLACTHGPRPAPPLLGALAIAPFGTGQFVIDLPVSTEISVKGGKGIWGMPKHQANLSFVVGQNDVSSRYDKDGRMVMAISIERPRHVRIPVNVAGTNYCAFRGLLMRSRVYFRGRLWVSLVRPRARLVLGDHPRADAVRGLRVGARPIATAFCPAGAGVLDDHFEGWFLTYPDPPTTQPEGLSSVVGLGLGQQWLAPPGPIPPERREGGP